MTILKFQVRIPTVDSGNYLPAGFLFLLIATTFIAKANAQTTVAHTVFGDLKVEGSASDTEPLSYHVFLYALDGRLVGRQSVMKDGRYRFNDISDGEYTIVVELENNEVGRFRVMVASPLKTDFRHDITLEWRPNKLADAHRTNDTTLYSRDTENATLFTKAGEALRKENYEQATSFLRQVVSTDAKDYEAWTELGTAFFAQEKKDEAEKAYLAALAARPTYILALINLGRLRLNRKNYEAAVETLNQAVKFQPDSASANYYLGEAYLQIKRGSKAVTYFNEALRLDPLGKAEAHLRLAALYHAAGIKNRAAAEYEKFLEKRPDFPNKKKLQQYISENK